MLRSTGPHKADFAYEIDRIHSLRTNTDLIEHNNVGDTEIPLLRCDLSVSKLKSGDITTTGLYMNSQTFSNLQIRPVLKNFFHSMHIDLRDTSVDKMPFLSGGITSLVLKFRKSSHIHF